MTSYLKKLKIRYKSPRRFYWAFLIYTHYEIVHEVQK